MLIDGVFESGEGLSDGSWMIAESHRKSGPKDASLGASVEQGDPQTVVGDGVTVGMRDALDETAQPEAPKVVSHASGGQLAGRDAQEWSEKLPEIAVGKTGDAQPEDDQSLKQRLDAEVPVAHG